MEPEKIDNLLAKYLAQEANDQEREYVEVWINKSSANRKLFQLLEGVWNQERPSHPVDSLDLNVVLADTHRRIESQKEGPGDSSQPFLSGKIFRYAAAAVILIGVILSGLFLSQIILPGSDEQLVYTSQIGETLEITLSDNTSVTLAPKSSLKVDEGYNDQKREVYLNGEARFNVSSNPDKPFIVSTSKTITKVLGTQFDVDAYPENRNFSVYVEEGRVSVNGQKYNNRPDNRSVILTKGDLVRFDANMEITKIERRVNVSNYLKWREGIITLENETLREGVKKLERWYPVSFEFEDAGIGGLQLTTEFSSSQSLEEILDAIALVLEIDYRKDGEKVILTKK